MTALKEGQVRVHIDGKITVFDVRGGFADVTPDGFTVLQGFGQFRGADGKIVREESKILVILYPLKNRRTANRKIEQIRKLAEKRKK